MNKTFMLPTLLQTRLTAVVYILIAKETFTERETCRRLSTITANRDIVVPKNKVNVRQLALSPEPVHTCPFEQSVFFVHSTGKSFCDAI